MDFSRNILYNIVSYKKKSFSKGGLRMVYDVKEKEKLITGFKFVPIYKEYRNRKRLGMLKIEYFNKGNLIGKDHYFEANEEEAEKIRSNLIKAVQKNLKLEENKICTDVVNMFQIINLKTNNELHDIRIEFIMSGKFFSDTCFYSLTTEQVERIRDLISGNTEYNLTVENQCSAVTWIDLVNVCKGVVN